VRKIVFFALTALVIFFLTVGSIFYTERGLLLVKKIVNSVGSPFFTIENVKGKLAGDWSLQGLQIDVEGIALNVTSVEGRWRPGKLLRGELDLVELTIKDTRVTVKDGDEEVSASSVVVLPEVFLPFVFITEEVKIENLEIVDGNSSEIIRIDNAAFQLHIKGSQFNLSSLFIEGSDFGLTIHGSVDFNRDWNLDLLGGYQFSGAGYEHLAGTFSINGPLNNPVVQLGMYQPSAIRAGGTVHNLLGNPSWDVKVNGVDVDFAELNSQWPLITLTTAEIDLSGGMDGYDAIVKAKGKWEDISDVSIASVLNGDLDGIAFQSLSVMSGDTKVVAEESWISWENIFEWDGHFIIENFNPAIVKKEFPGKIDAELKSSGKIVENGVEASFEIGRFEGILQQHQLSVEGNVFLTGETVYSDGLVLESGELRGRAFLHHGSFSWAKASSWAADISFENFDPASFYPELPGLINGRITGQGQLTEHGPEASLSVRKLSGTLRDQPLVGQGSISLKNSELQTKGLTLNYGSAEIEVRGSAGKKFGMDFSISIPDAGQLFPQGNGNISMVGILAGSRKAPSLEVNLQGGGLAYQGYSLATLTGYCRGDGWPVGALNCSLQGEGLINNSVVIDTFAAEIAGSVEEHKVALKLTSAYGDLQMKADGSYKEGLWRGQLHGVSLEFGGYEKWNQSNTASVDGSAQGGKLADFCLEDGIGRFCLDGELNITEDDFYWQVEGSVTEVILSWLNKFQMPSLPVNGVVNGQLAAKGDSREVLSAEVQLNLPEVDFEIGQVGEESRHIILDDTVFSGNLHDRKLLTTFSTSMVTGGTLELSAEVENFGRYSFSPEELFVTGDVGIKKFDLAFLSPLSGYWVEPIGKMDGELSLFGSFNQPGVSGKLTIMDGGIALPYQGITLDSIQLTLSAEETGVKLRCKATSGPGELNILGKMAYEGGDILGDFSIQGEDFLLFSLPEYEVRISPDARFVFSKEKGEISGAVKIPYALITPEEMTSSVKVSNDVIFIEGDKEMKEAAWPFFTKLNVQLGEDVRIDGYGLTGRLVGGLEVLDAPGSFLTGTGELELIDGTFSLYASSFDIERGRILFTGGPLDNPGIDARAQRDVSDEEAQGDGYVVGIDVSGFVQDLQFHLFSDPYMDDINILSYLLVGHSLADSSDEEGNFLKTTTIALGLQGGSEIVKKLGNFLSVDDMHLEGSGEEENVSLVVGKHITKDLYLGYDMNMSGSLGIFRIRYGLGHGFSVETQTSTESTGTDLFYTFER